MRSVGLLQSLETLVILVMEDPTPSINPVNLESTRIYHNIQQTLIIKYPVQTCFALIKHKPIYAVACKVGQASSCEARIPYEHWFKSHFLHFQSRSLLMYLGKQQQMAQVLGSLHSHAELQESPRSWV